MKNILFVFVSVLALQACSEEEIKTYDAGEFIYFGNRVENQDIYWDTIRTYNFFFEPGIEEKILEINVSRGGIVQQSEDKEFLIDVKVLSGSEGIDFDVERRHIMPAGKASVNIPVKFYRSASLEGHTFEMDITLVPNENFSLGLPEIYLNKDTIQRTTMHIVYMNVLHAPELWTENEIFFGYFSPAKFAEMSNRFGLTIEDWTDDERPFMRNYLNYIISFVNYLNGEIAKGPEYAIKDPDANSMRGYMYVPGYEWYGSIYVPPVVVPEEFPTTSEWEG